MDDTKASSWAKLRRWQELFSINRSAYETELRKMDRRESLYRGSGVMTPLTEYDKKRDGTTRTAPHVRNIVAENIEAQVSTSIPQPKIRARREKDEIRAGVIENMIRSELDRLPMEELNDLMERTTKIQGGVFMLVEWDNTKTTHDTVGEIVLSVIHPKQFIPQNGIYTSVEDMDYFFLCLPQTKDYIRRRYGVDADGERESDPETSSFDYQTDADDLVTQFVVYYRNENGGIGRFSWVNDIVLEDFNDYQARHLRRCSMCGAPADGMGTCPKCGNDRFIDSDERFEELTVDVVRSDGTLISAKELYTDDKGKIQERPTRIAWYRLNMYPIVLMRNVSVFGQLLGQSDADRLESAQNVINRIETKIIDRFVKAGTRITLPDRADIRIDPDDSEVLYIGNAADKDLIGVYDFKGDMEYELTYANQKYEEARNTIGITDSYQGRSDPTAVSGKAKEFAAAQTAGMLESKKIMKEAAYSKLFELIFRLSLAYKDEPRPVVITDSRGNPGYDCFNRFDFVERDAEGEYFYNDSFLFSCDPADALTGNRQAMWQEAAGFFSSGAMGDPGRTDTQIMFWSMMEGLHHPLAGAVKKQLQDKFSEEQGSSPEM